MNTTASTLRKVKAAFHLFRKMKFFEIASRCFDQFLPSGVISLGKSHVMVLGKSTPVDTTDFSDYSVRLGTIEDLPHILTCSREPAGESGEAFYQGLFADGRQCYLADDGSRVRGYCWVFRNNYTLTYDGYRRSRIEFRIGCTDAFVGNVFVSHDFRRQGIYSRILFKASDDMLALHKAEAILVEVKASNDVSLEAHRRRGFATVCVLYFVALPWTSFLISIPISGRPRVFCVGKCRSIELRDLCNYRGTVFPARYNDGSLQNARVD